MSTQPGIFHKMLEFASNLSIYHRLSLLIMAVMLCSWLLVGWQTTTTIWQHSRGEQMALANNLLRLSLLKVQDEHTLLVQYKLMTVVRQRTILEESLTALTPLFQKLNDQTKNTNLSIEIAQSFALDFLRAYPHTREKLFFVFSADNTLLFLPQGTVDEESLLQGRTYTGHNTLEMAKLGCLNNGKVFQTFNYTHEDGTEFDYTGCFAHFQPWGWFIARISNSKNVKKDIAERNHTFFSHLDTYFSTIPTQNGRLVLLDRKTNTALFPKDLPQKQTQALLRVSLPEYEQNKAESTYVSSIPGMPPSDMYSATYTGLKLQILFLAPRTQSVATAVNLIVKQAAILFCLFFLSILAIFLIVKRFTAPLIELTAFTNELSSSTDCILYSSSLDRLEQLARRRPDETSRLAHSFLLLQKALSERIQALVKASHENRVIASALHQLNLELDLRVQQRTRELEEANKELQTLEKSKTDFLSSVSHELRTPMTAIAGFITMIRHRLDEKIAPVLQDEKFAPHLSRIDRDLKIVTTECERLSSLIDTVLDISKIESGNIQLRREVFDPRAAIIHSVQTVSVLFEQSDIPLELDLPEKLPPLIGDEDRIIQVVINLLSNALKFSDKDAVSCRASQVANTILIQVTDRGIGIPTDRFSTIFNKYIQLNENRNFKIKGTGLGLAICKMIVEAHGGSIRVISVKGKGSTFTITLPTLPPDREEQTAPAAPINPH